MFTMVVKDSTTSGANPLSARRRRRNRWPSSQGFSSRACQVQMPQAVQIEERFAHLSLGQQGHVPAPLAQLDAQADSLPLAATLMQVMRYQYNAQGPQ